MPNVDIGFKQENYMFWFAFLKTKVVYGMKNVCKGAKVEEDQVKKLLLGLPTHWKTSE